MSLMEWQLLVHIYEFRNQMLTKIADQMSANLSDLIVSFGRLEKLGYAHLNDSDLSVTPTEAGNQVYLSTLPLMRERQKKLLEQLSGEERMQLRTTLQKLLGQLTEM
ncbi:MAG: hypothetical protein R3D32_10230 [Nitratireductor sp.]